MAHDGEHGGLSNVRCRHFRGRCVPQVMQAVNSAALAECIAGPGEIANGFPDRALAAAGNAARRGAPEGREHRALDRAGRGR